MDWKDLSLQVIFSMHILEIGQIIKIKGGEFIMKCSLGMLCEPLKSLGLHSHRSVATKRSSKRVAARKTSSRKKRK